MDQKGNEMTPNDIKQINSINETGNNILKEIIGSAMFFSSMKEYSTLVEEKMKELSGWDMIQFVEYSISRGCFICREVAGQYHDTKSLDFYSPESPVIRQLNESPEILIRTLNEDNPSERYEKKLLRDGFRNIYIAPIIVREKFVGVLACYSKSEKKANPIDLSILDIVAEILALAQEMYFYRKKMDEAAKIINDYEDTFIDLESVKILGDLTTGTAFEINGLLTGMLGQVEFLERGEESSSKLQLLGEIKKAALMGRDAIKNLQEFKNLDLKEEFTVVEIDRIVNKALELTRSKWRDESWAKNIEYKIEVDLRQVPPISGSPSALTEAFITAILKSLEGIPDGGKMSISTNCDANNVVVTFAAVKSQGVAIFNPFFDTLDAAKTGSNLSAARKIIKRHHGEMTMETKLTSGTEIVIILPITEFSGDIEEISPIERSDLNATILFVDDDQIVRSLVKDVMEVEGFRVLTAENGFKALDILKKGDIDILMTDLGMPGMSGFQLASEARLLLPEIPIIMATGWESRIDRKKVEQNKIDYIVGKPFLFAEIFEVVANTLQKKKKHKSES